MRPDEEQVFIELWQQGMDVATIAQRLNIPVGTAKSRAHTLQQQGKIQPRPRGGKRTRYTAVHPGTLQGYPNTSADERSLVHPMVHPSTPRLEDMAALWPELQALVAERRQRLQRVSTPGTPRSTVKKTYVFDQRHVDQIEQYARAHQLDLKDVVYAMCEQFFSQPSA